MASYGLLTIGANHRNSLIGPMLLMATLPTIAVHPGRDTRRVTAAVI